MEIPAQAKGSLRTRIIHESYIAFILAAIIVLLLTYKLGDVNKVTEYLNFALAMSSLLLSAVTIVLTIVANSDLSQNFSQLKRAGDDTQKAAQSIELASQKLQENMSTLSDTLSSVRALGENTFSRVENLSQMQSQTQPVPDVPPSLSTFENIDVTYWLNNTSFAGLLFLYAAARFSETDKILNLNSFAQRVGLRSGLYLHGYGVACSSCRAISWDQSLRNRNVKILSFNLDIDADGISKEILRKIERSSDEPTAKERWPFVHATAIEFVDQILADKEEAKEIR